MSNSAHALNLAVGPDADRAPVVLLHGSHGSESDLMSLACELAPGATRLGVRGTVDMGEGYAFFHRLPDRRVDEADMAARIPVLAECIETACISCNLTKRPFAIGFSNGAIMAAALLLTRPGLLAGAVLFRPLSPFIHPPCRRMNGTPVLIIDCAQDTRRSPGDGSRLAEQLSAAGALVAHHVLPVGHMVTAEDSEIAREWLRVFEL
ncbi:alpha/beta hydrolase [Nocardia sp. NBC_01327]|uniref:alpha/beta hydrolase n=1 Tax=Nocardia sp. NBC_01327 TaxID=2903593 RepID=UPI002E159254|nr:hypothetical protein OG326_21100 [Nocardia sp. NBC_01327]